MQCDERPGHQFPVRPGGEVPAFDPHDIFDCELDDQPALRRHQDGIVSGHLVLQWVGTATCVKRRMVIKG